MLRLLADENFNNDILRGLAKRNPDLDVIRVQDVGLSNTADEIILDWAARENRVLFTHDVATMTRHAYDRVRAGLPMPGVCEVARFVPVGKAVREIELLIRCSFEEEWLNQVRYLPL